MIAIALLAIALMGFSRSMVSSMVASQTETEIRSASEAGQSVLEELSGATFSDVFALYNDDPDDDPAGVTGPGSSFIVDGLDATQPGGSAGEILLPIVEVDGGYQVREDLELPEIGMPRDLNGDGVIDAVDHSGDYVILPVRVRLEWDSGRGRSEVVFRSVLMGV